MESVTAKMNFNIMIQVGKSVSVSSVPVAILKKSISASSLRVAFKSGWSWRGSVSVTGTHRRSRTGLAFTTRLEISGKMLR
jgi:hypothetical protein